MKAHRNQPWSAGVKKQSSATDPLWYKDAIIYELHVRAFADSNGDGIGDFPGLLSRLDYLQDLGITCIWLLPFFPLLLRDDGYEISNYVDVNPSYGIAARGDRSARVGRTVCPPAWAAVHRRILPAQAYGVDRVFAACFRLGSPAISRIFLSQTGAT